MFDTVKIVEDKQASYKAVYKCRKCCAIVHYPMYNEYYISQKLFKNSSVVYDKDNNVIGIYEHKD